MADAHRREQWAAAQRRYRATAKGRAAKARYRTSANGRTRERKRNARRIFIGSHYAGNTSTAAAAAAINAHIKDRLCRYHETADRNAS